MMKHAAPGSARSLVGYREAARRHGGHRHARGQPRQVGSVTASAGEGDRNRLVELPYLIVLIATAGGLAVIRLGAQYVKGGTLVIAGVLLMAATTRLVLPDQRAGMLSSRRRLVDVSILAALGLGLLVAGLVVHAAT